MKTLILAVTLLGLFSQSHAFDVEKKYKRACFACHQVGVGKAPKSFDVKAWEPALNKGMDTMVNNVIKGLGTMPPGGMCRGCSKEELEALIIYMSSPKAAN